MTNLRSLVAAFSTPDTPPSRRAFRRHRPVGRPRFGVEIAPDQPVAIFARVAGRAPARRAPRRQRYCRRLRAWPEFRSAAPCPAPAADRLDAQRRAGARSARRRPGRSRNRGRADRARRPGAWFPRNRSCPASGELFSARHMTSPFRARATGRCCRAPAAGSRRTRPIGLGVKEHRGQRRDAQLVDVGAEEQPRRDLHHRLLRASPAGVMTNR